MTGQIISHFKILDRLGEGGMGVVYKAQDLTLDRPVALKFISPHLASSDENLQRLLREARAASALNHPNVMTIYEVGEHDRGLFIAAEFIEGTTLRQMIRPGGLDVEFTQRCARQIAEALGAAHARGIVHRDIKPQNLMVTPDGRVKILDFGLARTMAAQDRLTRTGTVAGTLHYMSPEQIEGKAVDHRSDIFSLGVVLYEMLSGTPPFAGDYDAAVLYAIVNADPPRVRDLRPSIPEQLSNLIATCLRKLPRERFQNCGELLAQLPSFMESSPPVAGEGPPAEELPIRLAPAPAPEAAGRRSPVGRLPELAALRRALDVVAERHGRTVLVRGEAGIGKTHLVEAAVAEARARGALALQGRCLSREAGLPYHPFASALASRFDSGGEQVLERLAARAAQRGINVAGRMGTIRAFLKFSAEPAAVANKEQLWDALLLLIRLMAIEHPVVLALDDLQWADNESAGLFSFLARNIADAPVLLLGVCRSDADPQEGGTGPSAMTALIRQLKIEGTAEEIHLSRLTEEESAALVRQTLDAMDVDAAVTRRLHTATAGNPLFLCELVSLMRGSGALEAADRRWRMARDERTIEIPGRVRDVIAQRLARLRPDEREMLEFASCDGESFGSHALAACLKVDRITLLRRLQALETEHALIHHERSEYRFDNPLIRQMLYESILPELREEYHALIAGWLIAQAGDAIGAASRIGHHLLASAQDGPALEHILRAADHARSLTAFDEALELYGQADRILSDREKTPSRTLLRIKEGLGEIAAATGHPHEASTHFSAMLALARSLSAASEEIGALRRLADCLRILGKTQEALGLAGEALERARGTGALREQTACLNALAFIHAARGEYDRTIRFSEEALGLARQESDTRETAIGLSTLGVAEVHTGDYRSAAAHLAEAKSVQEFAGDRKGLAFTLNYLALVQHRLAQYDAALESARASLALKESLADAAAIPGTINVMGDVYRDSGDAAAAVEHHRRALALARGQNNLGAQCDNLRDLGADWLILGEKEQAEASLHEALTLAKGHGFSWYETRSLITLAELRLTAGALEEAEQLLRRGGELAQGLKARELIIEADWKKALVLSRLGNEQDAAGLLEGAITLAEASGHLIFLWQMYRDLANVLRRAGNEPGATSVRDKADQLVRSIAESLHEPALRRKFEQMTAPSS